MTILARKAARGDAKALEALLNNEEFQRRLERICQWLYRCWQVTGDYWDYQDLQQEVNWRLLDRIGQFKGKATVATYASTIARNIYLDHLRRVRLGNGSAGGADPRRQDDSPDSIEFKVLLREAVSKLSGDEQYVLGRKQDGATLKEIAGELSWTIWSVNTVLKRAQRKLVRMCRR